MTAPLLLAIFAVLVNTVGSRLLHNAKWTRRSPVLAILMWQALTMSVVAAVVMVGLALVFPVLPASADLAGIIEACATGLRERYQTPGGQAIALVGGAVAAAILSRVGYCLIAAWRTTRRNRAVHRQNLAVMSRIDPVWQISVVEHPTAAAYCIPGRHSRVVMTSGAMEQLDDAQIGAVVGHERAHLRGRHDMVLALFGGFRDAFPHLSSMRLGHPEVALLLEMRADDVALRNTDRFTLARALVGLSHIPVPAGAVAATGSALVRLQRIAQPRRPLGWATGLLVTALATLLMLAPLALVLEPVAAAASLRFCPIGI